jgi:hypothetical protein
MGISANVAGNPISGKVTFCFENICGFTVDFWPNPFRAFLPNGWDTYKIPVHTIPENALALHFGGVQRIKIERSPHPGQPAPRLFTPPFAG